MGRGRPLMDNKAVKLKVFPEGCFAFQDKDTVARYITSKGDDICRRVLPDIGYLGTGSRAKLTGVRSRTRTWKKGRASRYAAALSASGLKAGQKFNRPRLVKEFLRDRIYIQDIPHGADARV